MPLMLTRIFSNESNQIFRGNDTRLSWWDNFEYGLKGFFDRKKKPVHDTHEGRIFVPILCHLLTKTGHIWGNLAIVKRCYLIDIIIFVCCSLSLFTQYISLLISRFQVQFLTGAPAFSTDYRVLLFR